MAMLRWVTGNNSRPLPVYGPKGVISVVGGFNQAYGRDAGYRTNHHGTAVTPPSGAGMSPISIDLPPPGESMSIYSNDNLQIEIISADHFPVTPAVAYKFTYKGRSLLISGDTVKSAAIEKHSAGVDLMIHEALSTKLVRQPLARKALQRHSRLPHHPCGSCRDRSGCGCRSSALLPCCASANRTGYGVGLA
jgi:ribonuclease Z